MNDMIARTTLLLFGTEKFNIILCILWCFFLIIFPIIRFPVHIHEIFLPMTMHYPTSGTERVVYQGNLFVIAENGISTVLWIWMINHNRLTVYTYTNIRYFSCDIDPRQMQIDRVSGARCFAFRLLKDHTD